MRLPGKTAIIIITGAGSGIGEATAKLFAAEGAKVAIFDHDRKNRSRPEKWPESRQFWDDLAVFLTCDVVVTRSP